MNDNPLIYTDPTGECPWRLPVLSGAASGAGLDLLLQLLQNGGDLNCIDWESLGLSAALGAGGGGLSAKLLKLLSAKAGATIFKSAHYANRLEKAGVNVARAESAVAKEISAMRGSMEAGADVAGRTRIDNVLVEYRARLLSDGSVNVGTIFPVNP